MLETTFEIFDVLQILVGEHSAMEIVLMIVGVLSFAILIGSLACWIMAIIAAFKNEESPLMGILSIVLCGLGAFVIGWIKNKEYGTTKLMTIWTALFVGSIILQIVAMGLAATIQP